MEKHGIIVKAAAPPTQYSEAFKRAVVAELEKGILNKDQIKAKYGIRGKSLVLEWCRKFGKLPYIRSSTGRPMKDIQKQRIKDLEKQLEDAWLKVLAYEKLISIAEKEEGISILKKDAAKQLMGLPKPTQEK